MSAGEGRAPLPRRGDPNVKALTISLTPQEWRKLRAWAAEQATGVETLVVAILRRVLEERPPQDY
jgi:hypothetical protein